MKSQSLKVINDILDSDDELPSDYVETPYTPAFKNDDRFINLKFNLLNYGRNENKTVSATEFRKYQDKLLTKGILNSKDVFCSKCIEISDSSTLLWFVNFLLVKDLQSNYKFLKSCLVPQIKQDDGDVVFNADSKETLKYKLVIVN